MSIVRAVIVTLGLTLTLPYGVLSRPGSDQDEIEHFNANFLQLHLKMDTAGVLALWADEGVDLMQSQAPLLGKKAIAAWVENIVSKMPGYKVITEELQFHDIQVSGDWASEWAIEHQVVQPPGDKPVIEGFGKMALILHREGGNWKIKQEMWNSTPKPQS